jgi:hypothetical protein
MRRKKGAKPPSRTEFVFREPVRLDSRGLISHLQA